MVGVEIDKPDIKTDHSGWLFEVLEKEDVGRDKGFGQLHVTAAYPKGIKANHYHRRKTEWFCIIKGKGLMALEAIKTKERQEIEIDDGNPVRVKLSPNIAHGIKNIGSEAMYLLVYVDEPFDPDDPDTYYYEAIK